MASAPNDAPYRHHQAKTSIGFWCRQGLNPRSLILPSEILLIELTRTHKIIIINLRKNLMDSQSYSISLSLSLWWVNVRLS